MQRLHRKHFCSDCYPGYLRSKTWPTSDLKPLNTVTKDNMTPKCEKKMLPHQSAVIHAQPTAVNICCIQKGHEGIIKIAPAHPWTLLRQEHAIKYHDYWPGQNSKPYFCRQGIASTKPICSRKTKISMTGTSGQNSTILAEYMENCTTNQGIANIMPVKRRLYK